MKHPPKVGRWEIVLSPSLWFRNDPVDQEFDHWLNDALDRGEPIRLNVLPLSDVVYSAQIAGLKVWIRNAPYADATAKTGQWGQVKSSPSRRTALRFRRAVAPLLREYYRFQPPQKAREA